jgi:amino acid adenylation domain-containing protein
MHMTATSLSSSASPALRPIEDAYPLTRIQQALLLRCLTYPDQPLYLGQWWAVLEGELDTPAFSQAWQEAVDRHTALRSGFHWELKDQPFQVVHRQAKLPITLSDWTGTENWQEALADFLSQDRDLPFDIKKPPLMRLAVIRLAPRRHIIVWTRHHLTVDGWSLGILLDEVLTRYKAHVHGRPHGLATAPAFRSYVDWEKTRDQDRAREHWQSTLDSLPDIDLSAPHPISLNDARKPDIHSATRLLSADLAARLNDLARTAQVTVSTVLQTAWVLVCDRLLNQDAVLFGSVETIRPPHLEHGDAPALVGIQIQVQPVLARLDATPLGAWMQAMQSAMTLARDAGPLSMDDLRKLLSLPADSLPFDSLVGFQNYPLDEAAAFDGSGLAMTHSGDATLPDMPLNLMVERQSNGLSLQLMADRRYVSAAEADLRLDMLVQALTLMPDAVHVPVDQIDTLPPGVSAFLQPPDSAGPIQAPRPSVITTILAHAVSQSEAPAIVYGDERLNYGELHALATAVADCLQAQGIGPGARVGLHIERSPLAIAAILGIMLRGAAYVPIDIDAPEDRKAFIATEAGLNAIVSASPEHIAGRASIALQGLAAPALAATHPRQTARQWPTGTDEAYVIFTSGSTGRPKGVSITHDNLSYHVDARNKTHPGLPNRTLLLTFPLIFDGSVTGIFGTLSVGGKLVLPLPEQVTDPDRLAGLIEQEGVTQTIMIPSQWGLMLATRQPGKLASLELAIVGGEACPRELVEQHHALLPNTRFCNEYGPTETTVWATFELCQPGETGPVAIGRPIPGMRAYVVDRRGRLCPPGTTGELLIAGPGIARGYVGQPELTAERFVANPFHDDAGCLIAYRSGDQVALGFDGKLRFQGRSDDQVKVSGYRIELDEINACLRRFPGVAEAATIVHQPDAQARPILVAHVAGPGPENRDALLAHARRSLPAYMVPHDIVLHERLPRTSAGKLDRQKLPPPVLQEDAAIAPEGATETLIAQVWQSVLSRNSINRHDDFFAIGGRSLDAMQVVSRLRRELNVSLDLIDLFETPRLSDLAERLNGRHKQDAAPAIQKRQRTRIDLPTAGEPRA